MSAASASIQAAHRPRLWSPACESLTWPGAADYGIRCGPVDDDLGQVHRRKQAIVDDFRTGLQRRLEHAENVELILGEARSTGPKVVEVRLTAGGTRALTADTISINTGARPARPLRT